MSGSSIETSGFIVVPRALRDHPAILRRAKEKESRFGAFCWLIAEAAWQETTRRVGRRFVVLQRGQLGHAVSFMATAWKWSQPAVRRFIAELASDGLIDVSTDAGNTLVTIRNYENYQGTKQQDNVTENSRVSDRVGLTVVPATTTESRNQIRPEERTRATGITARCNAEFAHGAGRPSAVPDETGRLVPAEAVQIIQSFERVRQQHWPAAKPYWPEPSDRIVAKRWLDAAAEKGVSPSLLVKVCEEVFLTIHARQSGAGKAAIRMLKYHDQAVINALEVVVLPPTLAEAPNLGTGKRGRGGTDLTSLELAGIYRRMAEQEGVA